jgi:hypothetical protein
VPGAENRAGLPGGMPMMPGMGGAPQSPVAAHERSDASGLLGGATEPWHGAALPGTAGELGSLTGTQPGGSLLSSGETVPGAENLAGLPGGMPMMPMMPGMGGAPQQSNAAHERSDAAGLLGGVTEPWSGEAPRSASGEAGSATGAGAGGPGLSGMPFLPGAAASAGSDKREERSDASGLLAGESEAWTGDESGHAPEEAGSANGTAAGGPGLAGPGVAPAAPALSGTVPAPAAPAEPEDRSAWETTTDVAASLLFGMLNGRAAAADEDEIEARTVSVERDAWIEDPAAGAEPGEQAALATWQRSANAGGTSAASGEPPQARSGRFPEGYVPPKPELVEEAVLVAAEDDDEEEPGTEAGRLLVQDPSIWGSAPPDWSALE